MSRVSNRDKILAAGLHVVHERGFANASVRDITQAAQVPNGSFTNHFASKEAFGLEILDLAFGEGAKIIGETLDNAALLPVERLLAYIDANIAALTAHGVAKGCLIGNFGVEIGIHSEVIRQRVGEIFQEVQSHVGACLRAAVEAGELPADTQCDDLAAFIVGSLQGAIILAKTDQSTEPLEKFRRMLVANTLRR